MCGGGLRGVSGPHLLGGALFPPPPPGMTAGFEGASRVTGGVGVGVARQRSGERALLLFSGRAGGGRLEARHRATAEHAVVLRRRDFALIVAWRSAGDLAGSLNLSVNFPGPERGYFPERDDGERGCLPAALLCQRWTSAEAVNGPDNSGIGDLGVLHGSDPVGEPVSGDLIPTLLACKTNL